MNSIFYLIAGYVAGVGISVITEFRTGRYSVNVMYLIIEYCTCPGLCAISESTIEQGTSEVASLDRRYYVKSVSQSPC